jgi:cytosolic iron-sulfur protein assembly protein CIAO1
MASQFTDQPPTDAHSTLPRLQPLATLPAPHGRGVSSRAWQSRAHPSRSTPLLAVAAADKNVYIWNLRTFALASTVSGGHKRSIRCVDWKDYGRKRRKLGGEEAGAAAEKVTLATGSFDANVGIWEHNGAAATVRQREDGDGDDDDEEWNFTTLLTGPDSEIKDVHFAPPHYGANLLATSSRDKSVWVWEEVEEEEWETIAVLQEHSGDVKCVRWCEGVSVPAEGEGEVRVVGARELLASGSYDDAVRLWRDVEEEGDWMCIALLEGHGGTVWDLAWEGWVSEAVKSRAGWEADWEARLMTCSDDMTIRLWKRVLSEQELEKKRAANGGGGEAVQQRMPSIIRPTGHYENWVEETRLPQVHVRSVYAIDWSRRTGLVVSCAGDGTIAVYREEPVASVEVNGSTAANEREGDVVMANSSEDHAAEKVAAASSSWRVVALVEAAHDEFEVNHVTWAMRRDGGARFEGEEVIVSTADDGDVKIWTLPEELCR